MTAYAIAHLHNVNLNIDIVKYLQRIEDTLAPFGGKYIVHGGRQKAVEGPSDGAMAVIEFPNYQAAEAWYASSEYQQILPLRLNNADCVTVLAEHCGGDHAATDVLPAELLQRLGPAT